jgi:hypothetical protein
MLLVLLTGLVIRFHGLVWTLPLYFWGDETRVVLNGVTLQQTGRQNYSEALTIMSNYPPLRSWEVASIRTLLLAVGDSATNSTLVLYGRMFSLFYALLTIVFLYRLGQQVARSPWVGIMWALFFAVWGQTVLFGQRTLADGVGLMYFMLAAWLAVYAYQKTSYRALVGATVAGILAGLGKYNYAVVLLLPALAMLGLLIQSPRQLLQWVIVPAGLAALPILLLASQTLSTDDLYYQFLNERAQLEGGIRGYQLQGYSPESPEWRRFYELYPLTTALRLETNFRILLQFLPSFSLAMSLLGAVVLLWSRPAQVDYRSLAALCACAVLMLLAFSSFRVVEGRQLFGAILFMALFIALGLWQLAHWSRFSAALLLAMLILPMAYQAWVQNIELTKPDTRVATVQWLLENARDGTGVVVENEPYEFWAANGYAYDKHFNALRTYRLFDQEPPVWENMGYYYLVADQSYEWRGGYYAGHELQAAWDQYIEVVARFEGDQYTGPDRIIMRVFKPQIKVEAQFGTLANFYGYTLDQAEVQPGGAVNLKYFWWADGPADQDYIIFNHLLNLETGQNLPLMDRLAGHNGAKPSSQWEAKEWLFDEFQLTLPANLPDGQYQILIGLYSAEDGQRLPVEGYPDGSLPLATLTIESTNP